MKRFMLASSPPGFLLFFLFFFCSLVHLVMKGVYGRKSGEKDVVCYKSRETEPGTTKEPSKFSACGA